MKKNWLMLLSLLFIAAVELAAHADESQVRKAIESYVTAFNQQDLDSVAAMWAEGAVHKDLEAGVRVEGRQAIVGDLVELLKAQPGTKLSGRVDRVRFVTPDVAQVDGQTSLTTPDQEPVLSAFTAVLVNSGGRWLIDSIEEGELPTPPTSYDALRKLEWMVGKWVDESNAARVETTVRWTANQAFLLRSFDVELPNADPRQGTQVIGWDPRSKEIRSWSFDSDGSFGDGTWTKNGQEWLIKSSQTLADGQAASGTYVLNQIDKNTVTMQLIGHEIEGEPQPSSEVIRVVRVTDDNPSNVAPPSR